MKNQLQITVVAVAFGLAVSGTLTLVGPARAAEPTPESAAHPGTERWSGIWPSQRNPRGWRIAIDPDALEIAAAGYGDCTAWRSTILPPTSIRVYRVAYGPAEGTVQVVPLRYWAEQVLRTQMPAYYPFEALKANAIFVKQFGWYYTMHWRGGIAPDGNCYDVKDATDGFYRPEVYTPAPQHIAAQAATWPYTLRKWDWQLKTSRMFLTGYRAGSTVPCGTDSDGWHLMQHSAFDCGKIGHTWEGIMRNYVEPKLEIVDPGAHNLVTDLRGDAGVLDGAVDNDLAPRTYESISTRFLAGSASGASIDTRTLRHRITADVTGDRLDDIVALVDTASGPRLKVWAANGTGYDAPDYWWTDTNTTTNASAQLVADDFNADGKADVGLLVGPDVVGGNTKLFVLTSHGSYFDAPVAWWTAKFDLTNVTAMCGDVDGDGRGDLVLQREIVSGGLEFLVAKSRLKGGAFDAPVQWLAHPLLDPAETKTIVADTNRDGRDDIVAVHKSGAGTAIAALRSDGSSFAYVRLWRSKALLFSTVKLGAGDYNIDGRGDVLLLVDRGADGSRFKVFLPNDTTGTMTTWLDDPDLHWDTAETY